MIDYYTVEYDFECRWSQKDIDSGLDKGSDLAILIQQNFGQICEAMVVHDAHYNFTKISLAEYA